MVCHTRMLRVATAPHQTGYGDVLQQKTLDESKRSWLQYTLFFQRTVRAFKHINDIRQTVRKSDRETLFSGVNPTVLFEQKKNEVALTSFSPLLPSLDAFRTPYWAHVVTEMQLLARLMHA